MNLTEAWVGLCPGEGGNSRYIDGEVPAWENLFDPVLEKVWKKTYMYWKINALSHCFRLPGEPLG